MGTGEQAGQQIVGDSTGDPGRRAYGAMDDDQRAAREAADQVTEWERMMVLVGRLRKETSRAFHREGRSGTAPGTGEGAPV